MNRLVIVGSIFVLLLFIVRPLEGQYGNASEFRLQETTIREIHGAFASGRLSCVQLISSYIERIEAYDEEGPTLNAILTVNPDAMDRAAALDSSYSDRSGPVGTLHCIPVILKDNVDTGDMPTTGGSVTLAQSVPSDDAFIVRRLRAAGALILAKANLTELARGGTTVSSLGGQTLNPYDLSRTPGGSSGGTAASIAANFGVLGIGTDTGQSIRSPASAQSLVGVRPTKGLISRDGVIPLSPTQDEVGPLTRTVEDAARMLDIIVGYDPDDPTTAFGISEVPETYTAALRFDGLRGTRIGLLRNFLGRNAVHGQVNAVTQDATEAMRGLGAEIVAVEIPDLAELTHDLFLGTFEFKPAFNDYLNSLGPDAPVRSLDEFIARGEFHPSLRDGLLAANAVEDGVQASEYKTRVLRRKEVRQAVMTLMADNELDAILYPHQRRLVASIGEPQLERNGVLSNSTGFPAITFPGGFSEPMPSAADGVPIGIELLGPEWSEPLLLTLAYAFETAVRVRQPPGSTPVLRGHR